MDLHVEDCPKTCKNFLKLCKAYKYNYLTFFSVQKDFLAQTGDPTNTGNGGESIWSLLDPSSPDHDPRPYFRPDLPPGLKHTTSGTLSMACRRLHADDEQSLVAGSQFFVILADNVEYLDGKHAPFGHVVEGNQEGETLDKINQAFVDRNMCPLRDIRIQHVVVLDDPFDDPLGLHLPSRTPSPTPEQMKPIGLDASIAVDEAEKDSEELEEERRKRDTNAAALTLEMVGDLPFAEVRPPENILFVCKLNPVTRSEDLELIFSRFGDILSCEVIRDKKSGDSLQYAFIEFDKQEAAEQAYFKMQNVLVDDRRIWVDFSQSVSKLSSNWNTSRSGGKPIRISGAHHTSSRDGSSSSKNKDMVFDFDTIPYSRGDRRDSAYDDRRYTNSRSSNSRSDSRYDQRRHDSDRTRYPRENRDDDYKRRDDSHQRSAYRDRSRREYSPTSHRRHRH